MVNKILASIVLFLFCSIIKPVEAPASSAGSDTTGVMYQKANPKKIEGYIVLVRLRYDLFARWKATGKFPDDKAAIESLNGHVEYWAAQMKRGTVLLTGGMKGDYWDNAAIIILDVGSEQEANRIVSEDPAVKTYVFEAQVRPFDVHGISNKFSIQH
jgi:uncharacterized protein YciI